LTPEALGTPVSVAAVARMTLEVIKIKLNSMTTLKQGDLIKDGHGHTRKVLGTCGMTLHISLSSNLNKFGYTTDEATLQENGYTWDTSAWEPRYGMKYFFINENGSVYGSVWTDDMNDRARRDFLGIHQTKELAEAALLEIRRKLGR